MSAEALVITLLGAALDAPVSGDVPASRPSRFVTVERVGGQVGRFLDRGVYAIQVWEESRAKAAALAERVAGVLIDTLYADDRVGSVSVSSVTNFPDPESRCARYQVSASITTTTSTHQ